MRTIILLSTGDNHYFFEKLREVGMAKLSWRVSYHCLEKSEQENYIFFHFFIVFINFKGGSPPIYSYQKHFEQYLT